MHAEKGGERDVACRALEVAQNYLSELPKHSQNLAESLLGLEDHLHTIHKLIIKEWHRRPEGGGDHDFLVNVANLIHGVKYLLTTFGIDLGYLQASMDKLSMLPSTFYHIEH